MGKGHRSEMHDGTTLTFSFRRALNFFRHSTVSCLCIIEATVERCCKEKDRKVASCNIAANPYCDVQSSHINVIVASIRKYMNVKNIGYSRRPMGA